MRRLTGFHAVEELLKSRASLAGARILVSGSGPRIKAILEIAAERGIPVERAGGAELGRIAPDNRGLVLELPEESTGRRAPAAGAKRGWSAEPVDLEGFLATASDSALVLVLDHIEDPQNLGAIFRSADVFAADLVVSPRRRAAGLTEAVARASAGALAYTPLVLVPNLAEALRRLAEAGFWSYAADMGGQSLPEAELPGRCVIVLGNEGSGVSRLLKEECDGSLAIPQAGHVDSLNVSAAAAVLMYEYRRRYPASRKENSP